MMPTTSKITEFDIEVFIKKDVLEFNISMHDMSLVHISHCMNELLKDRSYFFVRKFFSFLMDLITKEILSEANVPCLQNSRTM